MALVSILIPVYNNEKYLEKCLESVVNQTLKDIEIICINDGSTDNSLDILKKYCAIDKRIKIINKENSGYGAALNTGLDAASAKYIGIVESDDYIDSKMYEDLYGIADKNNADIVKSDFYYYSTNEETARKAGIIPKNLCKKVINIKDDITILKIIPSIWSALYKKDFLNNNKICFLETKGASYQDTSFAFKAMSCAKRIVFANKSYLYYRIDNENSSVNQKDKAYAIIDEYNEITKFLNEHTEIKNISNSIKLLNQFKAYVWNAIRIDEKYRIDFINEFQKEFEKYQENNEITGNFHKKIKPKLFNMLLNDKQAFLTYINKLSIKENKRKKRQKLFSIRINSSRISIVLFGKQIVEIG